MRHDLKTRSYGCQAVALVAVLACLCGGFSAPAVAQGADTRPYDEKLERLAEILGAVHYLRELCSANDGLIWRDRMEELLKAEATSAARRGRLTRSFNQGYRSYRRTYFSCTPTAQTSVRRFMAEGIQIAEALAKPAP